MLEDQRHLANCFCRMLVGYIVKLGAVIVLYIYMYMVNKQRDREAGELGMNEERDAIEKGMHDVTELDNKGFR